MKTNRSTRRPFPVTIPYAVLLLLAAALPLHADQFGDFTYTDHGTYIEITDYPTSATGPVVIPATIVDKPVTSIGFFAFNSCSNLATATFMGDAPVLGTTVFDRAAPGFTVYYLAGSTGFTSPTWESYPAVEIDQSVHPAAVWLLTHGLPGPALCNPRGC